MNVNLTSENFTGNQALAGPGGFSIDSREIRARFGLGPFTGQLFIHAVGVAGQGFRVVVTGELDLASADRLNSSQISRDLPHTGEGARRLPGRVCPV